MRYTKFNTRKDERHVSISISTVQRGIAVINGRPDGKHHRCWAPAINRQNGQGTVVPLESFLAPTGASPRGPSASSSAFDRFAFEGNDNIHYIGPRSPPRRNADFLWTNSAQRGDQRRIHPSIPIKFSERYYFGFPSRCCRRWRMFMAWWICQVNSSCPTSVHWIAVAASS